VQKLQEGELTCEDFLSLKKEELQTGSEAALRKELRAKSMRDAMTPDMGKNFLTENYSCPQCMLRNARMATLQRKRSVDRVRINLWCQECGHHWEL